MAGSNHTEWRVGSGVTVVGTIDCSRQWPEQPSPTRADAPDMDGSCPSVYVRP